MKHLRQVFGRHRKYRISLNLKKFVFRVDKGMLLSHRVSKDALRVDPGRVEAIKKIPLPDNKKQVQYLAKLSFIRRFIPNFSKITKPISNHLKDCKF